jgi:hypothetical protein
MEEQEMKRTIGIMTAAAVLVPLLSVAPAGAATADSSTVPARGCDEGRWPLTVQGQPVSFQPGGSAGYYIWHDSNGWHLRTTTPVKEGHTFSGRITASEDIKLVHAYKDERADAIKVSGKTLSFRFDTHNHVDGVDFTVGCARKLRFELKAEGRKWPARRIALGATGHARSNPFTVSRQG